MSTNKICTNPSCNNIQPKDKWGNYKQYCSTECMKISRALKFLETYKSKDMNEILEKRKNTLKEKYGVDNASRIPDVIERLKITTKKTVDIRLAKTKETNIKKYGVESTNSLDSVKQKKRESFLEKYGVDHQLKIPEVAKRVSEKNSMNAKERLAVAAQTKLEIYGDANYNNRDQYKETCVERFGVENPSQNVEIHDKKMKSQYRTKEFIFPSGKIVRVQGYEPQALTELLKIYTEDEIITETTDKPAISYVGMDDKNHIYFPDIYIPKDNLLIEVKSQYTYNGFSGWYSTNMCKQKGSLDAGYNHRFMIMAKK